MLYRLQPPSNATWTDFPGYMSFQTLLDHNVDLDRLRWDPTEQHAFSRDLLRIALRHGVTSPTGLVLDAQFTVDLGRADELRLGQLRIDELQANLRATNGPIMEQLMPGWTAAGDEIDARVKESTKKAAREADADLAEVLAAPVRDDLAAHWVSLGGTLPD